MRYRRRVFPFVVAIGLSVTWLAGMARCAESLRWKTMEEDARRADVPDLVEEKWGLLADKHLELAVYYRRLSDICAVFQIGGAYRRKAYDSTAGEAAVRAFVAKEEFDSALLWEGGGRVLQAFVRAERMGNLGQFWGGPAAESPTEETDLLLLVLRFGDGQIAGQLASGDNGPERRDPLGALVRSVALADTSSIRLALLQLEDSLSTRWETEDGAPMWDRFGDPLTYWVIARAHTILAAEAAERALRGGAGQYASQLHLMHAVARYLHGEHDEDIVKELTACVNDGFAGIAAAYLAGVAHRNGKEHEAQEWIERCLEEVRARNDGEALLSLARVQRDFKTRDGHTIHTVRFKRSDHRYSLIPKYPYYWATGLIYDNVPVDTLIDFYFMAAGGSQPKVEHPFPDLFLAPKTVFCADYIHALAGSSLAGNVQDCQIVFNGLKQLRDVVPPTEPVFEGVRFFLLMLGGDNNIK